jgi:hypothetical protein
MPGNPREIITMAERRFPVRIRIAVPPDGLGRRHGQMTAWLDENCGSNGWVMTASGMRGVLNDAISIYFADATLAGAFVARWCVGSKVESAGGVFQVRDAYRPSRARAATGSEDRITRIVEHQVGLMDDGAGASGSLERVAHRSIIL